MADERIRRQIALLAARLMYEREESEYFTAKRKAARQLGVEYRYRPRDLPSNAEIRDQIQSLANPFKSSITGRAIERATLRELEQFLTWEYPGIDLEPDHLDDFIDRYELFRMLLAPLAEVKQSPVHHPEGDALYHSLQVFELAREQVPYDEEFLLAALLHDVGKAIDPADHVAAGIAALEGAITLRTQTLISRHMEAHAWNDCSLGHRARQRLRELGDFDDLMLLADLDKRGRRRGVDVCTIAQALGYIRSLGEQWGP